MRQEKCMWEEDGSHVLRELGIKVPFFVTFALEHGVETIDCVSPRDVAAIVQGGCSSGAWMPAVEGYTAMRNLCDNSREVFEFLESRGCAYPAPRLGAYWGDAAVDIVSRAVELWAVGVAQELRIKHGFTS